MGWFWSDGPLPSATSQTASRSSPGCRMSKETVEPSSCPVPHNQRSAAALATSCPVPPSASAGATDSPAPPSLLSKLNPLNYMFHTISQKPAPNQTQPLPTEREASSIPKGSRDGNWEYPSPQQMYNALLRKGYTDTDVTAVESMVAVHNFLNEGAWAEIVEWERRFGRGLRRGWEVSRRGEANAEMALRRLEARERAEAGGGGAAAAAVGAEPTLLRFQGRPKDMTPRAAMLQMMGRLYPDKYGTEPPFDRHDWYVSRNFDGKQTEVRYVIDYYSAPPEPTGEPVFYLDVRPAVTVTGACERLIRWGGDVWWRASGAEVREAKKAQKQ